MIADDDLDRFSNDLAIHVLDGHARGIDRGLAAEICIGAGLVVENSDAYDAAGALCVEKGLPQDETAGDISAKASFGKVALLQAGQ
jgi:hypothetical protein